MLFFNNFYSVFSTYKQIAQSLHPECFRRLRRGDFSSSSDSRSRPRAGSAVHTALPHGFASYYFLYAFPFLPSSVRTQKKDADPVGSCLRVRVPYSLVPFRFRFRLPADGAFDQPLPPRPPPPKPPKPQPPPQPPKPPPIMDWGMPSTCSPFTMMVPPL